MLPFSVKLLLEGPDFKFSSSIAIVWPGRLWGTPGYQTQALAYYICVDIKKERLMNVNS